MGYLDIINHQKDYSLSHASRTTLCLQTNDLTFLNLIAVATEEKFALIVFCVFWTSTHFVIEITLSMRKQMNM